MAKVDHLKQLVGRAISGERPTRRRTYNAVSFRRPISLTNHQERILNVYIQDETNLYNHLVEYLQARARHTPEFFKQLTNKHRELFVIMTGETFRIDSIKRKKSDDTSLPPTLEPYRDILFGIRGDTECGMSERYSIFYEICGFPAAVLKETRMNMAHEFLDFYTNNKKEVLERVTMLQKRHLQIPKSKVRLEWDEKDQYTKVYIPHLGKSPISMEADLRDGPPWNYIIIHQDPAVLPIRYRVDDKLQEIPWEIDFRQSMQRYQIKYLESKNPVSQMNSRFLGNRG